MNFSFVLNGSAEGSSFTEARLDLKVRSFILNPLHSRSALLRSIAMTEFEGKSASSKSLSEIALKTCDDDSCANGSKTLKRWYKETFFEMI